MSLDVYAFLLSAVLSVIFWSLEFYKMSELNLSGRPKTSGVWDCLKHRLETDCSEWILFGAKAVCGKNIAKLGEITKTNNN